MKLTAKHTVRAAYIGYLTQAITINFAPLLFITFENTYGITLGKISLLIAISFLTQLSCDLLGVKFSDKVNPRVTVVIAHLCAVAGMTGFAWLPEVLPSPYLGLVISVVLAAVGGGIVEVLVSPIVEACPTEEKSTAMSLLHSFYSWGLAGVVLLSTLFFAVFGIEYWRILSCLWAIIPAVGAIAFCFVPIYDLSHLVRDNEKKRGSLLRSGIFWVFFIMMFCAGAAEQAMGQWASTFAESGLRVSKAMGDLLGPFLFAILMGLARVGYAFSGGRIKLRNMIIASAVLCFFCFLITALSPIPIISLLGCALCGLSVGILWPGTYSLASQRISFGGVKLFAYLALAGDIGCLVGPTATGWIAEALGNDLKTSFLFATVFPVLILLMTFLGFCKSKHSK